MASQLGAGACGTAHEDDTDNGSLVVFRRLSPGALQGVLNEDDVFSCAAVYTGLDAARFGDRGCSEAHSDSKRLAIVGTGRGRVLGFRLRGVASDVQEGVDCTPCEVGRHSGPILGVAVDSTGTFAASCAADGSVSVWPLLTGTSSSSASGASGSNSSSSTCCGGAPAVSGHASTASLSWTCTYSRPVHCLAFCPSYASGVAGSRVLCMGGEEGRLVLNRRGTFESRNVTVHSGEGPISAVQWRGTLIAWANMKGVKIVDIDTYQKVTHIPLPYGRDADSVSAPKHADLAKRARCCLLWTADDVLLIGWSSVVMVAEVRQKAGGPKGVRFAGITHCFSLAADPQALSELSVCGVAPFNNEHLAVLTSSNCGGALAHHVCTWSGVVLGSEFLPSDTTASASTSCSAHLVLDGIAGLDNSATFVITAREVFAVERRSVGDHVAWLVGQGHFEAAIALASEAAILEDEVETHNLCLLCIAPLLSGSEFARAASIVRQLAPRGAETWKECVRLFDQVGEIVLLVPLIPAPAAPALPCEVYDAVLHRLVEISPTELKATLDIWPAEVFSAGPLVEKLRKALAAVEPGARVDMQSSVFVGMPGSSATSATIPSAPGVSGRRILVEALASLFETRGELAEAARLLARVGSDLLFPFLARHLGEKAGDGGGADAALARGVCADFGQLFDLNPGEALALASARVAAFPPLAVLEALEPYGRWWQHRYLRLLLRRSPLAALDLSLVPRQVELIAEFEPHVLRSFAAAVFESEAIEMSNSSGASEKAQAGEHMSVVDTVLAACRQGSLDAGDRRAVDVEVTLLARLGRRKEALELLLHELGDVVGAVRLIAAASTEVRASEDLMTTLVETATADVRSFSLLLICLGEEDCPLELHGATRTSLLRRHLSRPPEDGGQGVSGALVAGAFGDDGIWSSSLAVSCGNTGVAGFEIPGMAWKTAKALDDAEVDRDLQELSLKRTQRNASVLCAKIHTLHRRGVAVSGTAGGAAASSGHSPRRQVSGGAVPSTASDAPAHQPVVATWKPLSEARTVYQNSKPVR